MSTESKNKSLGQGIDEVIAALNGLDAASQITAIKAACDHLKIDLPEKTAACQGQGGGANTPKRRRIGDHLTWYRNSSRHQSTENREAAGKRG